MLRTHREQPVLITAAPMSRSEERHQRERTYALTMALRLVCFIVAVIVPVTVVRIVGLVGAMVLPWVAVVAANAVRGTASNRRPSYFSAHAGHELTSGADSRGADPTSEALDRPA